MSLINLDIIQETLNKSKQENLLTTQKKQNFNMDELYSNKFTSDDFLYFIVSHKNIKMENNKFIINENNNDANLDKALLDNKNKYPEVDSLLNQMKYIEIEGTQGKAYIIDYKGNKTLYLKGQVGQDEMFELNKTLTKMNIKPQSIIGHPNNMMDYRTLIDPNIRIVKRQHPNLNSAMLLTTSLFLINGILELKKRDKIKKIKAYFKEKRMKKSMYAENYDDEDDNELAKFKKKEKLKLTESENYFVKMNDFGRIHAARSYIYNHIGKSMLSDETKQDILENVREGRYDYVLRDSVNFQNAIANVVVVNLNAKESIQQLIESYDLDPKLVKSPELSRQIYDIT